jgi:biotin operon repressor
MDEDWFRELSGAGRGMVFQLILMAKRGQDNGKLVFQSYQDLGTQMSCSRNSCVKYVSHLNKVGFLTVSKSDTGKLHLYLCKYMMWQEMRTKDVAQYMRNPVEFLNRKNRQPDQTKPDHTRAEQETATLEEWLLDDTALLRIAETLGMGRSQARHEAKKMTAWVNEKKPKYKKWDRFVRSWLSKIPPDQIQNDSITHASGVPKI